MKSRIELLQSSDYIYRPGDTASQSRQTPDQQPSGVKTMFSHMMAWVQLKTDCRAVTALEYGLIAALIAGVIVTIVATIGTNLTTEFTTLNGHI
jgi:pilus assembly protein Flp/PilA